MPGSNYLYIRTIGVSGKSEGALYGPYSVTAGREFVTTDILPGAYREICVLASSKDLESGAPIFPIYGGNYSFRGIMTLPDDRFLEFISDSVDKSALDTWFDGSVCFGETKSVTIAEGTVNAISVTLTPTGSPAYRIPLYGISTYRFSSAARSRHFYRLEDIKVKLPVASGSLICKLKAVSGTGSTLSGIAFYSGSGAPVATTSTGADLSTGLTWTIDAATINAIADSTGYVELYQYMDFSGDIDAVYENTAGGLTVSFDGTATSAYMGKKVLFGIYDENAISLLKAGASWNTISPIGLGIVNLDPATGDGTATIPLTVDPAKTYYISAQIDSSGKYSSLADLGSVDLATIVPYRNDYVIGDDATLAAAGVNGCKPFTGNAVSLSSSQFDLYDGYVYFASQTGSGVGDSPADPSSLLTAVQNANTHGSSEYSTIYLVSDVSGLITPSTVGQIAASVCIKSYGSTIRRLIPGMLGSTNNMFSVTANGSLSFEDVIIDASGLTGSMMALLSSAGSLYLGPNTVVLGGGSSNVVSNGGCVYSTVSFGMRGATIKNFLANNGGAIYVAGGTATIDAGSLITANTAQYGGAMYITGSATGTFVSGSITGNTCSMVMGAVYIDTGSVVNNYGVIISGNTNGDTGGSGAYNQYF